MKKTQILIIAVIFLICLSFSFFLLNRPMWVDEVNTVLYARHAWPEMIELTRYDFSPPLYYIILKSWMSLTGSTAEWVLRLPSVLFGTLAGMALFFFSQKWFSRIVAWATTAIFFVSFSQMHYFFEVRMYSLSVLLAIISTSFLFLLLYEQNAQKKSKVLWWIGFLATSIAGVYTHYTYWFIVAGQNLAVFFLFFRKPSHPIRKSWLFFQLAIVISYIPWWGVLFQRIYFTQFSSSQYWTMAMGTKNRFFIENFLLSSFISSFETNLILITAAKLLIVFAFVLFALKISFEQGDRISVETKPLETKALVALMIGLTPIIFLWVVNIYIIRYALAALPFFILFVCFGLSQIWPKNISFLLFGALIATTLSSAVLSIRHESTVPIRSWEKAGKLIEQNHNKEVKAAIIVPSVLSSRAFSYYYSGNLPIFDAFPDNLILDPKKEFLYKTNKIGMPIIDNEIDIVPLKKQLEEFQEIWLVQYAFNNTFADPKKLIPEYLAARFQNQEEFFLSSSSDVLSLVRFY